MRISRTYKLRLSDEGFDLFLRCHSRVASISRQFIPYGFTLEVSVAMLNKEEACDIAADLLSYECSRAMGRRTHFVGASTNVAAIVREIAVRLVRNQEFSVAPKFLQIHIAALLCLITADEEAIVGAIDKAGRNFRSK